MIKLYISADFGLTESQQFGEHVVIKFEYYFAFLTAIDFLDMLLLSDKLEDFSPQESDFVAHAI